MALQGCLTDWFGSAPPDVHACRLRKWAYLQWLQGVLAICAAISFCLVNNDGGKTLGKEWSLTARLVEGHQAGYDWPVCAGAPSNLFRACSECWWLPDWLLATGRRLLAALVIFVIGTTIRVRSEEKLLREAFGEQFETYAQARAGDRSRFVLNVAQT